MKTRYLVFLLSVCLSMQVRADSTDECSVGVAFANGVWTPEPYANDEAIIVSFALESGHEWPHVNARNLLILYHLTQQNVLYTFDGQNLVGTLGGRKLFVVAARGATLEGDYPEKEFDFQLAYLRTWARMVGISEVHAITVEGTLFGPEADAAARGLARESARELGLQL